MTTKKFKSVFDNSTEEQKRVIIANLRHTITTGMVSATKRKLERKELETAKKLLDWAVLRIEPNAVELLNFLNSEPRFIK